ncbi:glycoside hydrolase family 16 protein [Boletus edulis BED1]|uniref:Glycoside hydrolase family 16 protein n=1 Tax=Boletus edulis BED1 TaxID=1328754 RepID=A0AAD4GK69_BOLED|nr:glycoside hydrolase family 16 protein [Boletus edulis BED1]
MYALLVSLLTATPLGTLASVQNTVRQTQTYAIQDWYDGSNFFSEWSFYTGADPTNGNVNYLSMSDAQSQGLAYVNSGDNTLVLAVDSTSSVPAGGYRNSVRITSNNVYSGGLFILDAVAMPVGCGTWPSFWTCGPNWPLAGEIDIVEGINNQKHNQMTLHSGTSNPCTIDVPANGTFTGSVLNQKCYSNQTADAGCSILDSDSSSFGYGFNEAQGGVFAFLWDNSAGMSLWHFARANIPADITNQSPTPANWGPPAGFWSSATCDIADNFYQHSMIFDITVCGGWAGGAYSKSGCPGTCSQMVANASNFADAQWVINYVAVYQ